MKAKVVPIGNSKGIRIPKVVLEQCAIENEAIMEVEKGRIIIMPAKKSPRQDWEQAFKEMHAREDDVLLIDDDLDLAVGDWEW